MTFLHTEFYIPVPSVYWQSSLHKELLVLFKFDVDILLLLVDKDVDRCLFCTVISHSPPPPCIRETITSQKYNRKEDSVTNCNQNFRTDFNVMYLRRLPLI